MKELTAFLTELGLFQVYNQYRYIHSQEKLYEFQKDKLPMYYIQDAFIWSKTNEGSAFWENIHDQWLIITKK